MPQSVPFTDAEGLAALAICESLVIALTDLKVISQQDVRDLLADVLEPESPCGKRLNGASFARRHPKKFRAASHSQFVDAQL